MAVTISLHDNKIYAVISGDDHAFGDAVSILRRAGATYRDKRWKIPVRRFSYIMEELEDLVPIDITEDVQKGISALHSKADTKVEKYRIPVSPEDFKVCPITGKAPFENYQFDDILKLMSTNRFALFNDMGTGKSYEFITALDMYRKIRGLSKVVCLTSNSGTYNLEVEFHRFSDFKSIIIGDRIRRRPFDEDAEVIIMNYRSFLLVSDEYEGTGSKSYKKTRIPVKEWLKGGEGALILDESHMVANPKSRQSKAVKMIAPFFKYIYLASGTPADEEQKYYAQLNILDPALVKHQPYQGWCQEYFFPSKYSEYDPGEIKPEKKEELQDIVQRVCVRRFATDVLALPENFIQDYYVQFTPEHKDIYQGLVTEMLQRIKNEKGSLSSRTVINRFQGLILAIDNPALILRHGDKYSHELTGKAGQFNFEKEHSKVEALLDIVEKHKNSKIVVWSSHPSVGDHLYSLLKKYNPLIIHGESLIPKEFKTRDQYKVYVKELFEKSDHQILIAGEQVLNTSITMVVPNVQVYFDVDFNYTNKNQSERRIYRIGQEQAVYTYNIIIGGSLDVVRAKNLKDKDFVNRKFLSHEYLTLDLAREMFTMEPDDE